MPIMEVTVRLREAISPRLARAPGSVRASGSSRESRIRIEEGTVSAINWSTDSTPTLSSIAEMSWGRGPMCREGKSSGWGEVMGTPFGKRSVFSSPLSRLPESFAPPGGVCSFGGGPGPPLQLCLFDAVPFA